MNLGCRWRLAEFRFLLVSTPLVDKKAFDHKRDWVQAWQQALEQVQSSFIRSEEVITRKAAAIQARETELKQNERMVMEAGARLKDVISGIQEDCEAIASVKAMQEDHEEELLKRLRQVEEQEAMIRQDGYIMSIKGKRAYEKDAAEFRRIEELRSLKRELENRIQLAIEYEQQLVHSGRRGGATGHLPATDDLPNI